MGHVIWHMQSYQVIFSQPKLFTDKHQLIGYRREMRLLLILLLAVIYINVMRR